MPIQNVMAKCCKQNHVDAVLIGDCFVGQVAELTEHKCIPFQRGEIPPEPRMDTEAMGEMD